MKSLLLALLMSIFAIPALAQRQIYLGETQLGPRGDRDVLSIRSCVSDRRRDRDDRRRDRDDRRRRDRRDRSDNDGRLRAFRFVIDRTPAQIRYVHVTFGNGSSQTYYPVRRYFPVRSSSRWFNLPGRERCIRSIQVYGNAEGRNFPINLLTQTRVIFYGLE